MRSSSWAALLLLPWILTGTFACRPAVVLPTAAMDAVVLDVKVRDTLAEAGPLEEELRGALAERLAPLGVVPAADGLRDRPRLQVSLTFYKPAPAPPVGGGLQAGGIATLVVGGAMASSGGYAVVMMVPAVLVGAPLVISGTVMRNRKSNADQLRGYPLQDFQADVVLLFPKSEGSPRHRNFKPYDAKDFAPALSPEDRLDPRRLRRATLQALAGAVEDEVRDWIVPPPAPGPGTPGR